MVSVLVSAWLSASAAAAPPTPPPWRRRRPGNEHPVNPNGQGLSDLSLWPAEPETPPRLDPERFARAYTRLCPRPYRKGAAQRAAWILRHSAHFEVDPTVVAALTYSRSFCRARFQKNGSYGLGAINLKMHQGHVRQREYRYFVPEGETWRERRLPLPDHLFYGPSLRRSEPNIYFTAALLRVASEQCPGIDPHFDGVAHRSPVSHLHWGDKVRGSDPEDRVLRARRRLLSYYAQTAEPTVAWRGLELRSPLDGSPRKLTGKMGDDRDGGGRRHRGVDFASDRGEPVYAIADGVVLYAGAQKKVGPSPSIPNREARRIPKRDLAVGGLYVKIRHDHGVTSAYMHLDDYTVLARQPVKRGDLLGYVGRSGLRSSAAHLHFEIRHEGRHLDPEDALGPLVFSPMKTRRGRVLHRDQRRSRRARRAARPAAP